MSISLTFVNTGFTKHFSMILKFLHSSLVSKKKQKLSPFLCYLHQTMFSVSKVFFFPSERRLYSSLKPFLVKSCAPGGCPLWLLKAFHCLPGLADPLLLCAAFQHQISVRQLEMGLEMCKLYCRLNKLVIS